MLQDTPKPYSPTNPEPIAGTPTSILGNILHRAEEVVEAVVAEVVGAFSSDELVDTDGLAQAIADQAAAAETPSTPADPVVEPAPVADPVVETPSTPADPVVETPVADPNAPSA